MKIEIERRNNLKSPAPHKIENKIKNRGETENYYYFQKPQFMSNTPKLYFKFGVGRNRCTENIMITYLYVLSTVVIKK